MSRSDSDSDQTGSPKSEGLLSRIVDRFFEDTEFNQSIVRFLVSPIYTGYLMLFSLYQGALVFGNPSLFLVIAAWYYGGCAILTWFIFKYPGISLSRRAMAMTFDIIGITYLLSDSGEYGVPIFAALVFTTMGYGLRYGAKYLWTYVLLALGGLAFSVASNDYFQKNPFLVAALVLTLLLIPLYAMALLGQLRKAVVEAERSDREKSSFLARASHDLRQPINAIGMLSARLENTELSAVQSSLIGMISKSVETASNLFQSLLDLSIIQSGGLQPDYRSVSVAHLFAELDDRNRITLERAGIDLRMVSTQKHILTDQILLTTMIQNIISNAIKYAPGSNLLIGCKRRGDKVAILICDQGNGISKIDLRHITEEFYRSDGDRENDVQGSGLGLAIVGQLAERMELDFDIQSDLGRGTSVEIGEFELVSPEQGGLGEQSKTGHQHLRGMRVLLVDDDRNSLHATQALLGQWGCQVYSYEFFPDSPEDCDIILSDFDFGPGKTLADHLKWINAAQKRAVPTVIVSGHQAERIHKAMKRTDFIILSKPVRPAELRSLLMAHKIKMVSQ